MTAKDKSYWDERHTQWINNQDKADAAFMKRLEADYKRTAKELEREIASYFQRYGQDNVIEFRVLLQQLDTDDRNLLFQDMESFALKYPNYAHLLPVRESIYKLNRLQGLHYSSQLKLLELGAIEQEEMERHLDKTYRTHYKNMLGELGIGHNFLTLDDSTVRSTIYTQWVDNKNFSERIWHNKDKLLNHLTTVYRDGIARGDNYAILARDIRERFGVGAFDAKRLVYTESSFVLNQSHAHAYRNAGVVEYELNAIIDHRTSKICKAMNRKRFKFEDMAVGVNFPPLHAFCRTTFIGTQYENEK